MLHVVSCCAVLCCQCLLEVSIIIIIITITIIIIIIITIITDYLWRLIS